MSRIDDLARELTMYRDDLTDELARVDQALIALIGGKINKPVTKPGKETTGEYACDLCEEKFKSAQGLGQHKLHAHNIKGQSRRSQARHQTKPNEARASIIELLRELRKPVSANEVSERLGMKRKTVDNNMGVLKRAKVLQPAGRERIPSGGTRPVYSLNETAASTVQQQATLRQRPERSRIEHLAPDMSGEEGGANGSETSAS